MKEQIKSFFFFFYLQRTQKVHKFNHPILHSTDVDYHHNEIRKTIISMHTSVTTNYTRNYLFCAVNS